MIQEPPIHKSIHQYAGSSESACSEPAWLAEQRKKALALCKKLPDPIFTYGIGINVDLSNLHTEMLDFRQQDNLTTSYKEDSDGENGHKGGVEVLDWKTALQQYGKEMQKYYMSTVAMDETKITALHTANMANAVVIRIPEHKEVSTPIVLSLYQTTPARIDHLLIIAKQNSKATIITSATSPITPATPPSSEANQKENNAKQFRSQIIEVIADDHASITVVDVQMMGHADNFSIKRAAIGKNASVAWIDCCMGSSFTQSSITNNLNGSKASGNITSLFFGGKGQQYDLYAGTSHHAPETTSKLQARGVLVDNAKSTFRGLIAIQPLCTGCEGYQKEDTLLIGDQARIDAVPILEIKNNDVKCSHGTSIGYVDDEKLFYMMSRGLSEEEARQHIIEGFLGSLVNEIPHEETRQQVMDHLGRMNQANNSLVIG
ncbi:Fe-S cluster assembly protein SufD [Candidatus Woesearchaeota archaeon]|nr:Fe-S cluster assembly protein SufD [Candidatus Woesearchaeota archaeon]